MKTSPEAARQLAKKMKLEDRMKPKLRRFFDQISRDVRAVWTATRSIPNLQPFELELVALLREQYRAIDRAFNKTSRDLNKSFLTELETKQEETIDSEIVAFINQHSLQQAPFILNTTQNELDRISMDVIRDTAQQGGDLDDAAIGALIAREFNDRSDNRVDTIAMTETQTVSESIKEIEAATIGGIIAATAGTQEMFKTWNTILDEKTRQSHVRADGQVREVRQPFNVQGQSLMAPGDTSLGATLDNIINCRCVSTFQVRGEAAPSLDTFV